MKYVLNSIIAALNLDNFDPSDHEDVLTKLKGETSDDAMDGSEPMNEVPEIEDKENNISAILFDNQEIYNIIENDPYLETMLNSDPEGLAFDLAEALYIFIHNYNEDTEKIHNIRAMLTKHNFKPGLHIDRNGYKGLSDVSKVIYKSLVNKFI
jgi:hypothetical protein